MPSLLLRRLLLLRSTIKANTYAGLHNGKPIVIHKRMFSEENSSRYENSSTLNTIVSFNGPFSTEECSSIMENMLVFEDFITAEEETCLLSELEPYLQRLRYEYDHWDDAIHGYRETERLRWTKPNTLILDRVRKAAFPPGKPQLQHVHVLDLEESGFIKPHIDSVRFCGDTIAGISLLSSCIMRLVHHKEKEKVADILLKQRSLYIMRNCARYDFTHEILKKELSHFRGELIPRGRRISVICRSEVARQS